MADPLTGLRPPPGDNPPNGGSPPGAKDEPTPGHTRPAGEAPPPRRRREWPGSWLFVALLLLGWNAFSLANARPAAAPVIELPYSAFLDQLDGGNVSAVSFQGNAVSGSLKTAITFPPP